MWKNRLIYLLILGGLFLFFVDYSGWISAFFLLLALLLPLFSLLLALFSLPGLKLQMKSESTLYSSSSLSIRIEVRMPHRIGDPLLSCRFSLTDCMSGEKTVQKLRFGACEGMTIRTEVPFCGKRELSLHTIRLYDSLGLFALPVSEKDSRSAWVLPRPEKHIMPACFSRLSALSYHPRPGGGYSEVHENRPYQPGDPTNTIHWKLSAKNDELIVREPQENSRMAVLLILHAENDRRRLDQAVGECFWLSEQLIGRDIVHLIAHPSETEGQIRLYRIAEQEDAKAAREAILSAKLMGLPEGKRMYPEADLRYDIIPEGGGHEDV